MTGVGGETPTPIVPPGLTSEPISVTLTVSTDEPVARSTPLNVVICEPQLRSFGLPYLPVMWGVLKTFWEQNGDPDAVRWHPPIHKMDPPEQIMGAIEGQRIDVLGLSCYTWNWRLQQAIARAVREAHPECVIVAGGPHPDYRREGFFEENPYLDAVVVKDGEVPFTRILRRVLASPSVAEFRRSGRSFADIPGLCLPGAGGVLTAPAVVPDRYDVSAYLAQRGYYEAFMAEHPGGVVAAWETSRGCPFRCSYCDWGSSTMTKVRRFDMGRLDAEIDWFAERGVKVIFSVDSNFGMFKTDVDITDAIVRAKERHGEPTYFVYSNAKNVPDRTVEITKKVVAAGLETAHTLSIQHSSPDVLAATDRANISIEKQIRVVRELQEDNIPISAQLILGLPGDTPALWRRTFTDLMEWGIHDGYIVTNYHLLPNAPAAEAGYMQEWGIKAVNRYIYDGYGEREDTPIDPLTFACGDVIVETSSFTRQDWVRMSVESAAIRALHNGGLTQFIARYLHDSLGVPYHDFYSGLLDALLCESPGMAEGMARLHACYQEFLTDPGSLAMLPMPGAEKTGRRVEPHRWFFASVCARLGAFFEGLRPYLLSRYASGGAALADLIEYQERIVVTPAYDRASGKRWASDYDWPGYFSRTRDPADAVDDPAANPGGEIAVHGTGWDDGASRGAFSWVPGAGEAAWESWFVAMATSRLSAAKCAHGSASCLPMRTERRPKPGEDVGVIDRQAG